MNLLELNKKAKEFITKEENIKEEKQNYEEIQELIYEISIGKSFHYTNNKELFNKMEIKLKNAINKYMFLGIKNYEFKLNKTNIEKIQKYIDKEQENEKDK